MLKGKGVQTTILCPMCEVDVEHLLHICLDCKFIKTCWRAAGIEFDALGIESCSEWLLQNLASKTGDKLLNEGQLTTWKWDLCFLNALQGFVFVWMFLFSFAKNVASLILVNC